LKHLKDFKVLVYNRRNSQEDMPVVGLHLEKSLTTGQVARCCQVSHVTVMKWIREGWLEAYTLPSGYRRVRQGALLDFMRQHGMPVPPDLQPLQPGRVLVIHRDPEIVHRLTAAAHPTELKYTFAGAQDELEAGLQIATFRPDALVIDLTAPAVDCLELCRRVKSNPAMAGIRTLVVVPPNGDGRAAAALEAGADATLTAPLSLKKVCAALDRVVQ
jgi:CheY-like chemotaxis protein